MQKRKKGKEKTIAKSKGKLDRKDDRERNRNEINKNQAKTIKAK